MQKTKFRPCIDLHDGKVKQIVGSSLDSQSLRTNFTSAHDAQYYAKLYKKHQLKGGHIIKLGAGNDEQALNALQEYSMQIGGGIDATNCQYWIDNGASHVILTSYLFPNAKFSIERLQQVSNIVGKDKLVVDLSCKRTNDGWTVAMNRWQTLTDTVISPETLNLMAEYCCEFLVHAADVEGLCKGIDEELVSKLGQWSPIACTYAGGCKSIEDIELVNKLSNGRVDLTIGSALDIFGGYLSFEQICLLNSQ